jgi:Zn-dependent M32 family carboxypeptidase
MGQMFKAQLLEAIAKHTGKDNPLEVTFIDDRAAGEFLLTKVLEKGSSSHFMELTEQITGEPFSAAAYRRSFEWEVPADEQQEAAGQDEEG